MSRVRPLQQKRGWAFAVAAAVVKPTFLALTKREWIDGELIPATGGCVVAVNHISHIDPLSLALLLYDHGRIVRYMAKQAIFETPVLKSIARSSGQIPVARQSADAAHAFEAAVQAARAGECIGVYPEGTITKDPAGWPMRGKTGAARIALATGVPVIPIGQWGAQEILPAYTVRPHLFPRKTTTYKVGDPVDLSEWMGRPVTSQVLHEATEKIMDAITELVADIRGEEPPAERFDPRKSGVNEIGNPNKSRSDKKRKSR